MRSQFTQTEKQVLLHDISPQLVMTTTSISTLVSRFNSQTIEILSSLKTPKRLSNLIYNLSISENLHTASFMTLFVKPNHVKRKTRGYLFISSTKELTLFELAHGIEEKLGTAVSIQIQQKKKLITFEMKNGDTKLFTIKNETSSKEEDNVLFDALLDFFDDETDGNDFNKNLYEDFFTSFISLPTEKLLIFPTFKNALCSLFVTIDLDFITKLQQLKNLDISCLMELGEIIFTLFNKNNALMFVVNHLINVCVQATENVNDFFVNESVFSCLMKKWLKIVCFDYYQNLALKIDEKYVSMQKESKENNYAEFLEYFLAELKLMKSFPNVILTVASKLFKEVYKKFPNEKNAPYFALTRFLIKKELEELIGNKPYYGLINNFLEIKCETEIENNNKNSNENELESTILKIQSKLAFALREIALQEYEEPSISAVNVQEMNKQFGGLMRFIVGNAKNLLHLFHETEFQYFESPISVFSLDLIYEARKLRSKDVVNE